MLEPERLSTPTTTSRSRSSSCSWSVSCFLFLADWLLWSESKKLKSYLYMTSLIIRVFISMIRVLALRFAVRSFITTTDSNTSLTRAIIEHLFLFSRITQEQHWIVRLTICGQQQENWTSEKVRRISEDKYTVRQWQQLMLRDNRW